MLFAKWFLNSLLIPCSALLKLFVTRMQDRILFFKPCILHSNSVHEFLSSQTKWYTDYSTHAHATKYYTTRKWVHRRVTYIDVVEKLARLTILAKIFWLNVAQELHAITACQSSIESSRRKTPRAKTSLTLLESFLILVLLFILLPVVRD